MAAVLGLAAAAAPAAPAALDEPRVPPGATGRFEFTMRAPSVGATQVFREAFAPLAEGIYG